MAELPPSPFLLSLLGRSLPVLPRKWSRNYIDSIITRANRRIDTLANRVAGLTPGRTMPDPSNIAIGSGKQFELAVMFLDVSGFTTWPSSNFEEQKRILYVMDVFMAEAMNIVRDHGGEFEKNTGDGIMAYFGTDTKSGDESVRSAVEAAVLIHYVNDQLISPWLHSAGLWPVRFRVGIDYGCVTIAKIGIHGTNAFVAIGATANIANRLLRAVTAGIAIGDKVYNHLPQGWNVTCKSLSPTTGHVYTATGVPYPVWELTHRLTGSPFF